MLTCQLFESGAVYDDWAPFSYTSNSQFLTAVTELSESCSAHVTGPVDV